MTFEQLEQEIKTEYGESDSYEDLGTISQTKVWVMKNMKIELELLDIVVENCANWLYNCEQRL